jgi:serine/threonine protein kinase
MPRYRLTPPLQATPGYQSEYESDGKTIYRPKPSRATLGTGHYARARLFESAAGKHIVVLDPKADTFEAFDTKELKAKYTFFKAIYPEQPVRLIKTTENASYQTYRLMLPKIPGITYINLNLRSTEEKINLFISAIQALKDAHDKGKVIVDLQGENIFYDIAHNKSYLIDGGLSTDKNTGYLRSDIFCSRSRAKLAYNKRTFIQIAPECWSPSAQLSNTSMDVYSLGILMKRTLRRPPTEVAALIKACLNIKPERRPTLDDLDQQLRALLEPVDLLQVHEKKRSREHSDDTPSVASKKTNAGDLDFFQAPPEETPEENAKTLKP